MTVYGKRKHKSDDGPTVNKKKMPDLSSFNKELVSGNGTAKPGDRLFCATKVGEKEEIPAGSIGCYIPEGREGILDTVLRKLKALELKVSDLESENEIIKSVNQRHVVVELTNDLLQLVYGIVELINDPVKTNAYRSLHFDEVLKNPDLVDVELYKKITDHQTYKWIKTLMLKEFKYLIIQRNVQVHPSSIDPKVIERKINFVGDGKNLNEDDLNNFLIVKKIFRKISSFSETETY